MFTVLPSSKKSASRNSGGNKKTMMFPQFPGHLEWSWWRIPKGWWISKRWRTMTKPQAFQRLRMMMSNQGDRAAKTQKFWNNWLVVEPTHLKNMLLKLDNGNLPQIGVKIRNNWNHHLVKRFEKPCLTRFSKTLIQRPPDRTSLESFRLETKMSPFPVLISLHFASKYGIFCRFAGRTACQLKFRGYQSPSNKTHSFAEYRVLPKRPSNWTSVLSKPLKRKIMSIRGYFRKKKHLKIFEDAFEDVIFSISQ